MTTLPPLDEVKENTGLWTNELRDKIRSISEHNLFFFLKAVCWYVDLAPCHKPLCENLEGRGEWGPKWSRAGIVAHRGWFKSCIVRGWALRDGLYKKNTATRAFSSSLDNAVENFLRPIQDLFRKDEGAEFRLWLYGDRIPPNFAGWTEDEMPLVATDAKVPATFSVRGVSSKREGYHGHRLILDDIEGAETERKANEQISALQFIGSANPLLIDPGRDQILLIGTVHGEDPVVYRVLHESFDQKANPPDGKVEHNNAKRTWKIFWQPIYNGDGSINFPERFNEDTVKILKLDPDMWAKQYLLQRGSPLGSTWKRSTLEFLKAKWKDSSKKRITYPYLKIDLDKWQKDGVFDSKWETHEVSLDEMYYTIHFDPKHKEFTTDYRKAHDKMAKAAIVVVGACPDGHIIQVDRWGAGEVTIDAQIDALYKMHEKWGARILTHDPVGAQSWLSSILAREEKYDPRRYRVMGRSGFLNEKQLPRLSSILRPDKRTTQLSKEQHIFNRLDPILSAGMLHFLDGAADDTFEQAVGFPDDTDYIDELDALAQGATTDDKGRLIWQAPLGRKEHEQFRREQKLLRDRGTIITHYRNPLRPAPKVHQPIHPELRKRVS